MHISKEEIKRRVRVLLDHDEDSTPLLGLGNMDALGFDDIIASKIVPSARLILLSAPTSMIDTGKPLKGGLSWDGEPGQGKAVVVLPDNFLRLLTIQLSDWKRPARIISEDDAEYAWQSSRYAGVRGNPDRPIAAICRYPSGLCVECYSSVGGAGVTMRKGIYLEEPGFDIDDRMELPSRLVESVVRLSASMACQTLGDTTMAAAMERRAMELAGIPVNTPEVPQQEEAM